MIHETIPVNNYQGNGESKIFHFNFYIDNESQLKVYLFDENSIKYPLVYNQDYSINETRNPNGSYITYPIEGSPHSVLKDNQKLSIELSLPISQETQYNNSSLLNLDSIEYSLDYLTRLIQILSRKISKCLKVEECADITLGELIDDIKNNTAIASSSAIQSAGLVENCNQIKSEIKEIENSLRQDIGKIDLKLDKSMANLDNEGKKVLNGQWISFGDSTREGIIISQARTEGVYNIDLSSYLPDDNCDYEIFLCISASSTTGGYSNFYTEKEGKRFCIPGMHVAINASYTFEHFFLPISTNRTLTTTIYGTYGAYHNLTLLGYRRIGTNE